MNGNGTFLDQTSKKLAQIAKDCRLLNSGFAQALIVRLHTLRLRPHHLLTPDGYDAIVSVATALAAENWQELMWSNREPLPKVWLDTLERASISLPLSVESFRIKPGGYHFTSGQYIVSANVAFRNSPHIWVQSIKKVK